MKLSLPLSLLTIALVLAACSSSTGPVSVLPVDTTDQHNHDTLRREGPSIRRDYDVARGGVQITRIYYDQKANGDSTGLMDEWIVLQSDAPTNTAGWTLNAGDAGQNYPLKSPLDRKLTIYTHGGPAFSGDTIQALNLSAGKWIWNNSDPDTAWVFDSLGNVVDSMSY
jgi:hypothetical protein